MKQVLACDYRFEIKKEDCWIGVFWRKSDALDGTAWRLDVWVCLVPMIPFHYTLYYR